MSSVGYSLKNGINRINNPSTGGVFSYGSYTSAGAFTLFTDYEYEDGTAFVSEPFDATKPLVWKGASQYPHLGFENLRPNSEITPQPFPSFGIYLHPFVDSGVRKDVGVRVTIPFGGEIAIASIIQRADFDCGDDIGYRIMKNGVAIQARQFIQTSNTPTTINTPLSPFVAGDIIDFIVDAGSQDNYFCDDVALEITLNYQYTKIPTPVIITTPIFCSTTTITGTTAYVSEGTTASIYDGTVKLFSTAVVLNNTLYSGSFSFTGLDLTNFLGKNFSLLLERSGDQNSDPVTIVVQDGGCVSQELLPPFITEYNICDVSCEFQREMSGLASEFGDVAIFEYPYTYGDPLIAVAVSNGTNWSVKSSNFKEGKRYIAFLLSFDASIGSTKLSSISCESSCELLSTIKGEARGITNGIIKLIQDSPSRSLDSNFVGIILNGKFEIKSNAIASEVDYVLIPIKIN